MKIPIDILTSISTIIELCSWQKR